MIDQITISNFKNAKTVVFFTGAGISAESGIPTFRGAEGIWKKFNPQELASFEGFMKNPALVWEWYKYRKQIVHNSEPNTGHLAIAELQKFIPNVIVITQNIDNLHRRAGSKKIYELHGNIEKNFCIKCKKRYDDEVDLSADVPTCTCGGMIRPDVVWFGEYLPQDQFTAAEQAAENCAVFIAAGTSAVVYPAAGLIFTAKQAGAYIIEINIEETEISRFADVSFFNKSGIVIPEILKELKKQEG